MKLAFGARPIGANNDSFSVELRMMGGRSLLPE